MPGRKSDAPEKKVGIAAVSAYRRDANQRTMSVPAGFLSTLFVLFQLASSDELRIRSDLNGRAHRQMAAVHIAVASTRAGSLRGYGTESRSGGQQEPGKEDSWKVHSAGETERQVHVRRL